MSLLTPELLANIGMTSVPRTEVVTRRDIRKYAVATGHRMEKYISGDVAPSTYHVALFWDVVNMEELAKDGVSVDTFLPKFPLERAMAGGLDITYHRPIVPGDILVATRTLSAIYEKQGSKGPLIFYEVDMEIKTEAGERVITEKTTRILR